MVSIKKRLRDLVPALLAAAVVTAGLATVGAGDVTALAVCRELLAGTDQGRQALVGSCWHSPLVSIVCLPFAWLLGVGIAAAAATAWLAWTFALTICGRISERGWAGVALMALLACGVTAVGGGAAPAAAVPAAVAVFALRSAALWHRDQRLRDLVKLAAALAGLILCGAPLFGVTAALALAVPLGALRGADTRRRLPAVLLLGWLPLFYALGVWLLMNGLIFGSPLFFVANLRNEGVLLWQRGQWRWLPSHPAEIAAVAAAAYALVTGTLTGNRRAGTLGVLGVVFWLWLALLRGVSAEWADAGARVALMAAGALALWHLRHGHSENAVPWVTFGDLAIFAVVAWIGARMPLALAAHTPPAGMIAQVEADALTRSPHARIFVCGYAGLGLIPSSAVRDRFEPNLDLYVNTLRDAYFGQNLFLLVPEPIGAAATENVHTRLPTLYAAGGGRMLFCQDYGPWRLFEIVGAPTARQLELWRESER